MPDAAAAIDDATKFPETAIGNFARREGSLIIPRRELLRRLSVYATRSTPRAAWYFFSDIGIYALAIAGVLFLPLFFLKLLSSVLAGLALGRLFSFAHNAAHENLAQSKKLNR